MPKQQMQNTDFSRPETVQAVLLRLLSVTQGRQFHVPSQMLDEIEAISIEGADPNWQIMELQKILDRWAAQH